MTVLRDQDFNGDVKGFCIYVLIFPDNYKLVKSRKQEYPSMASAVEDEVLAQVMYFRVICFSEEGMWGDLLI